jgi:hypothetical protein
MDLVLANKDKKSSAVGLEAPLVFDGIFIQTNYENQKGGQNSIAIYGEGIRDEEVATYLDGHGARKPRGGLNINGKRVSGIIFPKKVSIFKSLMFLFKNLKLKPRLIGGPVLTDSWKNSAKVEVKKSKMLKKEEEFIVSDEDEDEDEYDEDDDEHDEDDEDDEYKPMVLNPKKRSRSVVSVTDEEEM